MNAAGERREMEKVIRRGRAWRLAMVFIATGVTPAVRAASVYDEIIAPIFAARCTECHGERKQKAKLALHTWEGVARGGESGPIFVAGKPGESVLLERLRLPLADEEHMPPQEKPQPAPEEIALIARWIERGAAQNATLADLALSEPLAGAVAQLPAKLAALDRPAAPVDAGWEFDAAAVAKARAPFARKVAELQRRFPGALSYESRTSAALHFTTAGLGRTFGDAELVTLAELREQLVQLDLSGSGVTDASAGVLVALTKLRVLRTGFTVVGDETVQAVAKLPALEVLALNDTKVTGASVGVLTRMRTLRALHLADTDAEAAAQAANLPVFASAASLIPPIEPANPSP